jgi:hypothetical protein
MSIGDRRKPDVPVHVAPGKARAEGMPVDIGRPIAQKRHVDTGLFGRFPRCCGRNGPIGRFNVATQLHPELPFPVETQEDGRQVGVKDKATRRDV